MKAIRTAVAIALVLILLCLPGCQEISPNDEIIGTNLVPLLLTDNQFLFFKNTDFFTLYSYDLDSKISALGTYQRYRSPLDDNALINDTLYFCHDPRNLLTINTSTNEVFITHQLSDMFIFGLDSFNNQLLILASSDMVNEEEVYSFILYDPVTLEPLYTSPTTYTIDYKNRTGARPTKICTNGEYVYLLLHKPDSTNGSTSSIVKLDQKLEPISELILDTSTEQIASFINNLYVYGDCIYLEGSNISTVGILQDDTVIPLLSKPNLMPAAQLDKTAAPVFFDKETDCLYIYDPVSKTLTETPISLEDGYSLTSAAVSKDQILLFARKKTDPDSIYSNYKYLPILTDRDLTGLAE